MTAINIVRLEDRVHLFCDTLATSAGAVSSQVAKCMPLPHLNVAIATRGPLGALDFVGRMVSFARDFHDVRRILADDLQPASRMKHLNVYDARLWGDAIDVFVVGVDETGPQAFAVFTHGEHGLAPWLIHDIGYLMVTPRIADAAFQRLADGPIVGMADAMALQAFQYPQVVGGHIIETIVSGAGISSRSLGILPQHRPVELKPDVKLPMAFAKHLTEPKPGSVKSI